MRYTKNPVTIDAIQFDGTLQSAGQINQWSNHKVTINHVGDVTKMVVPTLEGVMTASPGDYIIRGVKGEYYPCKPDVFEVTYKKEAADYKERLQIELSELQEKINKLSEFIFAGDFNSLEHHQQSLLRIQLVTMRAYETCLIQRTHEAK